MQTIAMCTDMLYAEICFVRRLAVCSDLICAETYSMLRFALCRDLLYAAIWFTLRYTLCWDLHCIDICIVLRITFNDTSIVKWISWNNSHTNNKKLITIFAKNILKILIDDNGYDDNGYQHVAIAQWRMN